MKRTMAVPSANEFSPGVVDLGTVLLICKKYKGDRDRMVEGVRDEYFSKHAKKHKGDPVRRAKEQRKLANNVIIGLNSYGLLNLVTGALTGAGDQLIKITDRNKQNTAFASYILGELNGIEMLQVIRQMHTRSIAINKKSLATELNRNGFTTAQGKKIPLSTTDHTKLIGWLRKAGVFPVKGYEIVESEFEKLAGISDSTLAEISSLTHEQKSFLRTLKRMSITRGKGPIFTKDVSRVCEIQHGPVFNKIADQLAKLVFIPLEKKGWLKRSGMGKGRGGKSGKVVATEMLLNLDEKYLDIREIGNIPPNLVDKLNKPIAEIYSELKSEDKHIKGIALEILAYRLTSDIGLEFLSYRERSANTGGAEVDLICEGVHLHYSRWLIQCKNTKQVSLSALAKEIGMAMLLNANVIVIVTPGRFASSVVEHARALAEKTPLQAVLIDKNTLDKYEIHGLNALLDYFQTTARKTLTLKRAQFHGKLEEK